MHIFRWLLSHPIITAWILAALAILLNINMGSKSEEHTQVEVAHVASENVSDASHGEVKENIQEAHLPVVAKEMSVEKTSEQVSSGSTETDESHSANKVESAAVEKSVEASVETKTTEQTSESSESEPKTSESAQEVATAVTNTAQLEVEKDQTENASNSEEPAESGDAASAGLESMSEQDLLKLAREAFWQNEKDKSAAVYHALIEREPSSLSYKGELANVLWHQNKQKESAALYAEIAMPMLKQGKTREVGNMLGFIGVFFPEKAREIHRSMSE